MPLTDVPEPRRVVVALGGGGFQMEPGNPLLDDYVVERARDVARARGRDRPRITFLGTATGDAGALIARFHAAFGRDDVDARHVTLFGRPQDPTGALLSSDAVYVGGGNTANMLAVWRVHGVDRALRTAWTRGTALAGVSAGMICWFECGVTDSFGGLGPLRDGLSILPGSACPHWDGEPGRRRAYLDAVADGLPAGWAADDGAALVFRGTALQECVSSRPAARVVRVEPAAAGGVVETRCDVRYLGAS